MMRRALLMGPLALLAMLAGAPSGRAQGGYSTTVLGEQLLDKLAGLIILGAGRRNIDRLPPDRTKLRGKPIFVGVGAKDEAHNGHAHRAAKNYKAWGAAVTFEEWPDLGHRPDQNSEKLREWLLDNGPPKRQKDESPTDRKGRGSRDGGD